MMHPLMKTDAGANPVKTGKLGTMLRPENSVGPERHVFHPVNSVGLGQEFSHPVNSGRVGRHHQHSVKRSIGLRWL